MLALQDECIHPESQQKYIKSFSGGKNNSPEGQAVRLCHTFVPPVADLEKSPYTHGFVVEFESPEDRDYYVYKDPAHQDFVKFAGGVANSVKVVDYEPGKI